MIVNTAQRTSKEEFLDDFSLEGDELRDALDKIATINQWLGGNKITLDGLKKLLKDQPNGKVISVVDVGCGNGDMCRAIADFGKKEGIPFKILGIDANADAINHAKACSEAYPTITYTSANVFGDEFASLTYDVAVCTLTLHHFSDKEILQLMGLLTNKATLGVVINDLQRSALAYRLFQLICVVFGLTKLSKEDGLTSILRGFKKHDLESFSKELQLKKYWINWRWAFRYQWIIKNL
ncbi:methyltransferase domain-containing protein [Spirosoma sp. KCTC 42546]|uniref:methyltransferase domain-containing protein n=1 Tax=Spirosoma sp. KCTC 42546 TaxID=2520506 RepID=UPI00115A4176|nr:methyltransferase domain-containing protein [Spirosoma sp. KCTC 42546]QDK83285.1 methyltransferase domain-containing protein [Spirosoma sp. KCTC 42546]